MSDSCSVLTSPGLAFSSCAVRHCHLKVKALKALLTDTLCWLFPPSLLLIYPSSTKKPQWPWPFSAVSSQVLLWYSVKNKTDNPISDLWKLSRSISTREQMSLFYFKFQFRNVEYSSGRNKTLLCFRVDTPGGSTEPLKGYMEDEHATAHAEEAFFQQVTHFSYWRITLHICEPPGRSWITLVATSIFSCDNALWSMVAAFLLDASINPPSFLSRCSLVLPKSMTSHGTYHPVPVSLVPASWPASSSSAKRSVFAYSAPVSLSGSSRR